MEEKSRQVEVKKNILAKNEEAARENREWLSRRGMKSLNLISSPGAGKTTLLEKTLERLSGRIRCGVIVGDQQTDNDARRLSGRGAEVRQIETVTSCHLDAVKVPRFIPEVMTEGVRLLFIENVGNLICPAAFDLGENGKVVLLSVTEGEDKPIKYPVIFSKVIAVVITKVDLAPHLDWDREKCLEYIGQVSPSAKVFELSARTGEGMEAWVSFLEQFAGSQDVVDEI